MAKRLFSWSQNWFKKFSPEKKFTKEQKTDEEDRDGSIVRAAQLKVDGKLNEAAAVLECLVATHSTDTTILFRLGEIRYLQGRFMEALRIFERTLGLDAKHGMASKFRAASLMQIGNAAGAISAATYAESLLPEDAELQNMLGAFHMHVEQYEEAGPHFVRAVQLNPTELLPLLNFHRRRILFGGVIDAKTGSEYIEPVREQVVNSLIERLRQHEISMFEVELLMCLTNGTQDGFPAATEVAYNYAAAQDLSSALALMLSGYFMMIGDIAQTKRLSEYCFQLDHNSEDPGVRNNLGISLIVEGGERWHEGWSHCRVAWSKIHPHSYVTEIPPWEGQELGGRRLFVYQEQGFGDALLALRFIPLLAERGICVVLAVRKPIAELAKSIPGYEEFHVSEFRPDPRSFNCAYACALLDLIEVLRLPRSQVRQPPLLKVSEEKREYWRNRFAKLPAKRIGLCVSGNAGRQDDWLRTIPTENLKPLLDIVGVSWINFAVDRRSEVDEAMTMLDMIDPTSEFKDFSDTAAAAAVVDALVVIDCSVAHVAASLGKTTWVLVPSALDWRWQIADDLNPWWPTSRVIRADGPATWINAMCRLAGEIHEFVQKGTLPQIRMDDGDDVEQDGMPPREAISTKLI